MDARIQQLLADVQDPGKVAECFKEVKEKYPPFPTDACAGTLSQFLRSVGINVPFTLGAGLLAHRIQQRGWSIIPVSDGGAAGDVFVTVDANGTPGPDQIGFVAAMQEPGTFLAADNRMTEHNNHPYSRNVGHGGFTRIAYFLRAPG